MSEKLASKGDHKKGYKASTASSRNATRSNTRPKIKQIPGADYVNEEYRIAQITEWKEKRDKKIDVGAYRKAIRVFTKDYGHPD